MKALTFKKTTVAQAVLHVLEPKTNPKPLFREHDWGRSTLKEWQRDFWDNRVFSNIATSPRRTGKSTISKFISEHDWGRPETIIGKSFWTTDEELNHRLKMIRIAHAYDMGTDRLRQMYSNFLLNEIEKF